MKKTKILLYLLIVLSIIVSCKKEIEEISELLETDYKVIEFYYGYDNYFKNIRDDVSDPLIINERNIVEINIDKNGNCNIEGRNIVLDSITSEIKKYIIPNPQNEKMAETLEKEFTYAGKVILNKSLIISVLINENINYKKYSEIRNKIYIAHNEVRNNFAVKKYGKELSQLMIPENEIERKQFHELIEIFPLNYFEMIPE
tara:strand:- start:235 stop:837 length:603 start_codon:yes stop_codon:yes gene_type:complete